MPLNHLRPPPSPLCVLALAVLLSGCVPIYTNQSYTVTVLDGDTGLPVPNTRVNMYYFRSEIDLNGPSDFPSGVTDARGQATLVGTTFEHYWGVETGSNYLNRGGAISPNPAASTATSVQLEIYRLPKPSLTLVIPDGFHGPVLINPDGPGETMSFTPGQRQFTFQVPPSGRALFKAPRVFIGSLGPNFGMHQIDNVAVRFVTVDGREIPLIPTSFKGDKLVADAVLDPGGRSAFNALNFDHNLHTVSRHPIWVIGGIEDAEPLARQLYLAHQDGLGHEFNNEAFEAMFSPSSAPPTISPHHVPR